MIDVTMETIQANEDFSFKAIKSKLSRGEELTAEDLQAFHRHHLLGIEAIPRLDRPLLDQIEVPQIVRHIGMVQDMLDPEYYLSSVNGRSTHFRDAPLPTGDSQPPLPELSSNLAERQPLFIVPLPFASPWLNQQMQQQDDSETHSLRNKSPKTVVIPESPSPTATAATSSLVSTDTRKRDRADEEEAATKPTRVPSSRVDTSPHDSPAPQGQESDWWPAGTMDSAATDCPILAKLYYDQFQGMRRLRLNDVVECVGLLSMDPWEADFSSNQEQDWFQSSPPLPPPSRLPRLHVLSYRLLELEEIVMVDQKSTVTSLVTASDMDHDEQPSIAMFPTSPTLSLTKALTSALSDPILARALALTLSSKAERHREVDEHGFPSFQLHRAPQHALGCASLQLLAPDNSRFVAQQLLTALQEVCPIVTLVDWNETVCNPRKSQGRLQPCRLQLPKGATVIIHVPGTTKTHHLPLLTELVAQHRLPYTFEGGMNVPFDADYRIIVVSSPSSANGAMKLPCVLHWKLEGDAVGILGSSMTASSSKIRTALISCRRLGNIALDSNVLERAQQDFLTRRQENRKLGRQLPQEEDFHRWLTLVRVHTRARGATQALLADWQGALELDDAIQEHQA